MFSVLLTILGLSLFETISSVDNAIINGQVLSTMQEKARRWFLFWGLIFSVFLVRGILPWLLVFAAAPSLGPVGSFFATLRSDPRAVETIESAAPILLMGGSIFLLFIFLHWLFLEEKHFGLPGERFFYTNGVWFYAVVSVILALIVWFSLKINPLLSFSAVLGSTAFFIVHGFRQNAEQTELKLMKRGVSDVSKILYLEIIDATFSVDAVLGAFAFTLSIPLILLGNGLGAFVVRKLTVGNINLIGKYVFLKNGAMYSVLFLGLTMLSDGFGVKIPSFVSPALTFLIVGFFFLKSRSLIQNTT